MTDTDATLRDRLTGTSNTGKSRKHAKLAKAEAMEIFQQAAYQLAQIGVDLQVFSAPTGTVILLPDVLFQDGNLILVEVVTGTR